MSKINVSKMSSYDLWKLIFDEWWRKYEYEVYYPLTSKFTQMEINLWWDEDHYNIYNTYYKNVNIQLYSDEIKFLENSRFEARTKKDMFNLYTFLKDKLYEEGTTSMNKSKLITKPQLKSYILEGLSTLRQMCDNNDGYFRYVCHKGVDSCFELQLFCNGLHNHIDVHLSDDKTHWTIFYDGDIEIRIQIYQDKITFDEDAILDDCFAWLNNRNQFRREMHDLYVYLNERIFGANQNDTVVTQDVEHRKKIEPFKTYLSLALNAFESIKSCKYAPCEFCKHRNEDDTPFCGEGHKWEWEYAEDVKRLLNE